MQTNLWTIEILLTGSNEIAGEMEIEDKIKLVKLFIVFHYMELEKLRKLLI